MNVRDQYDLRHHRDDHFVTIRRLLAQSVARHACFAILWICSLFLFALPLVNLVHLTLQDDRYSYILAVPGISILLAWLRKTQFSSNQFHFCPGVGVPLLLTGAILFCGTWIWASSFDQNGSLSLALFAVILSWAGVFVLCYGRRALRLVLAPTLFLLLLIPLPAGVMDRAAVLLQQGSAEMTHGLFKFVGVPFFREGFRFSLPGIEIEIAEECSGIRSSMSLLLVSILAGHLFLRSSWRKLCFILVTVPIVIFKNALRITTLSWLALHVDPGFLYGSLHRSGGLVFAIPAFALMALVLWILRKSEAGPEMALSMPTSQNPIPSNGATNR